MSYAAPYVQVANGGLQTNAGSTNVVTTPSASTLGRDLVVVVCYMAGDATNVNDAGDGWVILDAGYDSGTGYGIFMAACLAPRAGATGYSGLTLPASVAWTAGTNVYRVPQPYSFDLSVRAASTGWFNATASATALDGPAILQPYPQVIDLVGRGYNNAGTTTTVANITNYTERFDQGQASPAHGITLNDRTAQILGTQQNASVTSALAVAKTNRAGVRAMIGIVGNTMAGRGRYGSSRRAF